MKTPTWLPPGPAMLGPTPAQVDPPAILGPPPAKVVTAATL